MVASCFGPHSVLLCGGAQVCSWWPGHVHSAGGNLNCVSFHPLVSRGRIPRVSSVCTVRFNICCSVAWRLKFGKPQPLIAPELMGLSSQMQREKRASSKQGVFIVPAFVLSPQ